MGRLHEWKGRKNPEHEGYPFDNGPPWRDSAGNPKFPPEAGLGPADADGLTFVISALPNNTMTITVTGTATANTKRYFLIDYDIAGEPPQVVSGLVAIMNGDDQDTVAAALGAAIYAVMADDNVGTVADNVVTVTLSAAGTVDRAVLFAHNPLS